VRKASHKALSGKITGRIDTSWGKIQDKEYSYPTHRFPPLRKGMRVKKYHNNIKCNKSNICRKKSNMCRVFFIQL